MTADELEEGNAVDGKRAMDQLLNAMYNRPYTVDYMQDLDNMIVMADFYCALPIVSHTLIGALHGSKILLDVS
jgi:hypothetical protein